jgi:putative endonuclease
VFLAGFARQKHPKPQIFKKIRSQRFLELKPLWCGGEVPKMNNRRQRIGRWGEKIAADYLVNKGYKLLATNVRTPYGEIDLICQREGQIVFVEVKTRTSHTFGYPEESVNQRKQAHMLASAEYYLQEHENDGDWQFDMVAVEGSPSGKPPRITHFENVLA